MGGGVSEVQQSMNMVVSDNSSMNMVCEQFMNMFVSDNSSMNMFCEQFMNMVVSEGDWHLLQIHLRPSTDATLPVVCIYISNCAGPIRHVANGQMWMDRRPSCGTGGHTAHTRRVSTGGVYAQPELWLVPGPSVHHAICQYGQTRRRRRRDNFI